jgi:hypothetical protein
LAKKNKKRRLKRETGKTLRHIERMEWIEKYNGQIEQRERVQTKS